MAAARRDKDELIAANLAVGKSYADAGKAAGVSERTVQVRMTEPGFRALVKGFQDRAIAQTLGTLSRTSHPAAVVLGAILASADEKVRLAAAKAVIELTLKVRDQTDTVAELAEIRRMLKEGEGGNAGPGGSAQGAGTESAGHAAGEDGTVPGGS